MSELVERLRVALDEAEKQTRAATPGPWLAGTTAEHLKETVVYGQSTWPNHLTHVCNTEYSGRQGPMNAAFIAAWDPARVLRLIERDRALLLALASAQANTTEWLERSAGQPESKTLGQYFDGSKNALLREVERAADFWLGDNHG